MANNRLTWRDVTAPDYGSSMRGAEAANRMFQDALGGLNTSLGSFITNRKAAQDEALLKQQQEAEAGYLRQMAAISGDTEEEAALRRGLSGNALVSNDFLKDQLTAFRNSQLTGNTTAENLSQTILDNERTNRDNEYIDQFRPIAGGVNAYVSSGGDRPFEAMSDEQLVAFSQLPATEQTRLLGAWSGEQTSNLGRTQTQQNIDDRDEKRIVEDLVGAARAETPFIDEQQALIANYYRNGDITPRMYEQASQQLQRAASSGGTGGGGTGTAAGGTSTGGGNTLIDPTSPILDPSSRYSSPDIQDIVQNIDDVIADLTRGAGTVASSSGVQRSDRAKATDISPSEAVARVMEAKAFENADPTDVQYAIYDVMNNSEGNLSYAEAADIVAMSPSRGSTWYNPATWFTNRTLNEGLADNIANQWTSPNLGKDRETLQEIGREQANLEAARERINRDSQKLDEMVNHAFRNGLSLDTPAIKDLQESIQLDIRDLGAEAERIRGKNLGERIRNPATGEFGYSADIREAEAKAARSRAEAQAQAEKDAQRITARMKEMREGWFEDTSQSNRKANVDEYRRLKEELYKANNILQKN